MERALLAVLGCGSAPLMETKYVQKIYLFLLSLSHTQCSTENQTVFISTNLFWILTVQFSLFDFHIC